MGRRLWGALTALGALGLYGGARVLGLYWDYHAASAELPQAARDYKSLGLPWTAADLDRHVATKDNAAPLVRRAIAAMPEKGVEKAFDEAYAQGTADPAPYGSALALFHEAARLPDLDFGRDWDLGPALVFPELAPVKQACKVLAVRAERKAAHGDDRGALDDLEDARRLGVLLGKESSTMGSFARNACDRFVQVGVGRCLAGAYDRSDRLELYRRWLDAPPIPIDERAALRGEIYSDLAYARNLDRSGVGEGLLPGDNVESYGPECRDCAPPSRDVQMRRDGLPETVRSRAHLARFLQTWIEIAHRTHGLNDPLGAISDRVEEIGARHADAKGLSYRFNPVLYYGSLAAGRAGPMTKACRAVSRTFADALVLHARTGRWLTSTETRDPFGRGPLHVRFDGKRFRVWSVGRNQTDEGGLTAREASAASKRSDDIVAAYPPIPRTASRSGPLPPILNPD